jgi:ABC-type glycerol-3-phosphate transport system substrate-binding protein
LTLWGEWPVCRSKGYLLNHLPIVVFTLLMLGFFALPSIGRTKISVWVGSHTNETLAWFGRFQDEFNRANPKIELEILSQGSVSAMRDKVIVASAASVGPDIFNEGTNVLSMYVSNGLALPLDRYFRASEKKDFLPDLIRDLTFDGQLYGIPFMVRPLADAYNLNLFETTGTQLPETWDDMIQAVRHLNRVSSDNVAEVAGLGGNFTSGADAFIRFQMLLEQLGATAIEPDGKEVFVNTPQGRRVLEYMVELYRAGVPDRRNRTVTDFMRGNVGVMHWVSLGHPSWADACRGMDLAENRVQVRRYVGPTVGQQSVHYIGSAFMINSTSQNPDEAWRALEVLTNPGSMKGALMAHGLELPPRTSLIRDADLLSRPFVKEAMSVMVPPLSPFGACHVLFPKFRVEAGNYLVEAVQERLAISAALEGAERIANAVVRDHSR